VSAQGTDREKEDKMGSLLEIVDLEKRFELHILNEKEIDALHDVSFDVKEGEKSSH
jgi:ABC-type glutathione transport system ATPase component